MGINETSKEEKDDAAEIGTLWETNVLPELREKEISKESEVDITDKTLVLAHTQFSSISRHMEDCSYPRPDVSKAM